MIKRLVFLCILSLLLSTNAFAQNVNDIIRQFRDVIREGVRQAGQPPVLQQQYTLQPSFDCRKARAADEITICSNPELSQLDNAVVAGYQYARDAKGDDFAKQINIPLFRARQACGADVNCIRAKQIEAITTYHNLGAPVSSSLWNLNGSTMRLIANGRSRTFVYENPRTELVNLGATSGSISFQGEAINDQYRGTAYFFASNCGQIPYQVSGPILDNYEHVALQGASPRVGLNCAIQGYARSQLDFKLAKGGDVLQQPAPSTSQYYFVANTTPPDDFLSLRTLPSSVSGERIATMPNGTPLEVLKRQSDGWWYVRVVSTGQEGWALSGQGNKTWIVCCQTVATSQVSPLPNQAPPSTSEDQPPPPPTVELKGEDQTRIYGELLTLREQSNSIAKDQSLTTLQRTSELQAIKDRQNELTIRANTQVNGWQCIVSDVADAGVQFNPAIREMNWIVKCKFEDLAFSLWSRADTQGLINIKKGSVVHFDARTICASQNCQLFPTEFVLQNIHPEILAELPKNAPPSSDNSLAAAPKQEPPEPDDNLVALESQGGTYVVPVIINNAITLNFVVDSGASDVSIPADVVMTLVRTGTLKEEDFIGRKTYALADGSTVPSATFRIKSLKVGNRMIDNVTAGIAPVQGQLLLGQSFLNKFNSWSIDNTKHVLILK